MDHTVLIHVITTAVYFASVVYIDTRYLKSYNELHDELYEERVTRKELEQQLEENTQVVDNIKEKLESLEGTLEKLRSTNSALEEVNTESLKEIAQLIEANNRKDDEINALNKKVSQIVESATNLVQEAEIPHLTS